MIPAASTISLGGTSNVGKTRWLAGLVAALAAGQTLRLGLPAVERGATSLWLANEERTDDIARRCKAAARQHNSRSDVPFVVRGKDSGMLRLVALNEIGTPEIDEENVASVVAAAREHKAELIIFDPYVTLSDGDENSTATAAMLTRAFLLITNLTGAAVLHAHHTPKDRSKDIDWYRGSSDAWRGSGTIYSGLDCGFTLSHWLPSGGMRKQWKQAYLEQQLGRWIVLDSGKVREGEPLKPVVYELVGQEMDEGEGMPIGVCRLSSADEAENALLHTNVDAIAAAEIAGAIIACTAFINYSMAELHKKMRGHQLWPDVEKLTDKHKEKFFEQFAEPIKTPDGVVQLLHDPKERTSGRWVWSITEREENDNE